MQVSYLFSLFVLNIKKKTRKKNEANLLSLRLFCAQVWLRWLVEIEKNKK